MTRKERLDLLKQIEKDIHVCSLESTLLDDAKSCAIHSVIEELEQEPKTGYWIKMDRNDPYWYMCSECHRRVDDKESYCPSCGAIMQESERV